MVKGYFVPYCETAFSWVNPCNAWNIGGIGAGFPPHFPPKVNICSLARIDLQRLTQANLPFPPRGTIPAVP